VETVAVIDFETTGLAPEEGARATEIAVVLMREGQIVDRFQSLMNARVRIPAFIEALTGITNAMIRQAPPVAEVMRQAADFIGDTPLIAHNAAFDRKFLDTELARVDRLRSQEFACTVLLSRRLYPKAPDHKLGTLVRYNGLPVAERAHRALADAEMTAHLLARIEADLKTRYELPEVRHDLLRRIQKASLANLDGCIQSFKRRMQIG